MLPNWQHFRQKNGGDITHPTDTQISLSQQRRSVESKDDNFNLATTTEVECKIEPSYV